MKMEFDKDALFQNRATSMGMCLQYYEGENMPMADLVEQAKVLEDYLLFRTHSEEEPEEPCDPEVTWISETENVVYLKEPEGDTSE